MYLKNIIILCMIILLQACVAVSDVEVENDNTNPQIQISGVLNFSSPTLLPQNSKVTVAVIDRNKTDSVLTYKTYSIGKLPAPFFLLVPKNKIDKKADYIIWASVQVNGIEILRTNNKNDDYRVINNSANYATVVLEVIE